MTASKRYVVEVGYIVEGDKLLATRIIFKQTLQSSRQYVNGRKMLFLLIKKNAKQISPLCFTEEVFPFNFKVFCKTGST